MAFLNSVIALMSAAASEFVPLTVVPPGSMWHRLILNSFAFVADYGWRIVVFTVLLKFVISPLDFYQRYKMNKNQKITERLRPTMEKIQKQYGNDKQAFSQKQMELNRKEGYSYFSSCLPMILTMVIFITLWLSMQTIAEYMTFKQFVTMYDEYRYVSGQIYDKDNEAHTDTERTLAEKIGQDVVYRMYYQGLDDNYVLTLRENAEYAAVMPEDFTLIQPGGAQHIDKVQADFLWIQNIWAPDVPWGERAVLSWSDFYDGVADYKNAETSGLSTANQAEAFSQSTYEQVMARILSDTESSRTNGYLVLPILVILLSVGSQLLSTRQQKRAGQVTANGSMATSMKVMMVVMPIMMAVFAVQFASIFALYMTVNSAVTLFLNILFTGIIKLMEYIKRNRNHGIAAGGSRRFAASGVGSPIIHYVKGANPNAGAKEVAVQSDETTGGKRGGKNKNSKPATIRGGRPDPNELMGMDMSSKRKK